MNASYHRTELEIFLTGKANPIMFRDDLDLFSPHIHKLQYIRGNSDSHTA